MRQHRSQSKTSKSNYKQRYRSKADKTPIDRSGNNGVRTHSSIRSDRIDRNVATDSLRRAFNSKINSSHRSPISEISREATAGGVIYRYGESGRLEILLVADHFNRWTIPKGHIEEGETAQETAIREIGEEAGVHQLEPICWLGKIHFRYRREDILVLMSTQIYLFRALGDTDDIQKEDWMNGIKWFSYEDAVEIIAYRDIAKLMRLGYRRLQQKGEID